MEVKVEFKVAHMPRVVLPALAVSKAIIIVFGSPFGS